MLAIAGGKGGVGKTTVTLALARSMAERDCEPIVVDADVDMPDLHVLAGVDREPTASDIATGKAVGTVLQSPRRLPGVGVVTAGQPGRLPAALSRLRRCHRPVLVDCPAGASNDAARPLRECHRSLAVTTDTPAAIEDTIKTTAIARRLGAPPVAVCLRGQTAVPDGTFDCPVEHVPAIDTTPVYTDPRLRAVCVSLCRRLPAEWPGSASPLG